MAESVTPMEGQQKIVKKKTEIKMEDKYVDSYKGQRIQHRIRSRQEATEVRHEKAIAAVKAKQNINIAITCVGVFFNEFE